MIPAKIAWCTDETEFAQVTKESKVLEIGTGSGYQAAVLGEVAGQVYSIEIVEPRSYGLRRKASSLCCSKYRKYSSAARSSGARRGS